MVQSDPDDLFDCEFSLTHRGSGTLRHRSHRLSEDRRAHAGTCHEHGQASTRHDRSRHIGLLNGNGLFIWSAFSCASGELYGDKSTNKSRAKMKLTSIFPD
jgi:hypothetical protein